MTSPKKRKDDLSETDSEKFLKPISSFVFAEINS